MNESLSFSGSLNVVSSKDTIVQKSAPNQSLNQNVISPAVFSSDSIVSQPVLLIDTPVYAKPIPAYTWDSLLFHDITSLKNVEVNAKPVFFRSAATQDNSLHSSRYTDYTKNANDFKKPEFFTSTPWFLASVFMCLILFTWLQYFFQKHIVKMFVAVFSNSQASRLFSDKNILLERVFTFLNINYIITAGLFVFQLLKYYNISIAKLNDLQLFVVSCLFLFLIFILRFVLNFIVGQLFNWKSEMKEYNYNVFLSYKVLGLVMLPIVISMAYIPEIHKSIFIYVASTFIAIFYVIRYIRGMYFLAKKGFLLFYMILYFCTIEILPLLLLYRWLYISM